MPFFWSWGAGTPSATTVPSVTTALWTKAIAPNLHWVTAGGPRIVPRFEHVYPQIPSLAPFRRQDFVFRVQTQFPFIIGSGNAVFVKSSTSDLP